MKWTQKIWKNGDECTTTFFAWLPVSAPNGDKMETRWLTTVTVRQKFCSTAYDTGWWDNLHFVD